MPQPRATFIQQDKWIGRHRSYTQPIEGYHKFAVYQPPKGKRLLEYNRMTKELQGLIKRALDNGKTLRAIGSSWSLSKVGMTDHELINTKNLSIVLPVPPNLMAPEYTGDREKLRFLETGAEIVTINRLLFQHRLSLKASGSNDGQTLAGVISTNTHGSAFKFGSTQDFVVGLHLITGPRSHVYLQRDSYRVVNEKFAQKLGAKLINDDTLFNAALVSFGSFGIIHGTMIEARDLFLLHASRRFQPFDAAIEQAISALDFSGYTAYFKKLEREATKRNGFPVTCNANTLYHFQVTVNPNEAEHGHRPTDAAVYFMFEGKYREDYEPPPWDQGAAGPGASGLELLGELFELAPGVFKPFVKKTINESVRNLFQYDITGTFLDLFRGEKTRGKVFASGIGLELSNALPVLDLALRTYEQFGTIMPILITLRFVKATDALLGFTKFAPVTCVLEIDGINTANTRRYANQVWNNIEAAGIPFTMHWGKFNTHLNKSRVRNVYGMRADAWIHSRERLLKPDVRQVFTNAFLKRVGLAT
ncbi:MAG: FAD-binding protein [Nitrospirae bacterium]|nr:MAG: FAD-binding protein [Nitrospirota bacterium]